MTGCVNSVISTEDPVAARPAVGHVGPKLGHAHLLDRALKPIPGKSTSAQALGLIVGFQSGIEKQKAVERYTLQTRYKVEERYSVGTAQYTAKQDTDP